MFQYQIILDILINIGYSNTYSSKKILNILLLGIILYWLVVWNMNELLFHSVGNFIIPTEKPHHFLEG